MNKEVKSIWIVALESGDYQQGRSCLQKNGKFCCLGVLSDLAVKAGVIPQPTKVTESDVANNPDLYSSDIGRFQYGKKKDLYYLPEEVVDWAGLDSPNPHIKTKTLSYMNDDEVSFTNIAAIIKENL